jgi:hypothetical protein
MNQYEQMMVEIQMESQSFKTESQSLKENLAAVIAENNRLKLQSDPDGIGAFRNNYILVADKIFTNLRNQLYLVNQVRDVFCVHQRSGVCVFLSHPCHALHGFIHSL